MALRGHAHHLKRRSTARRRLLLLMTSLMFLLSVLFLSQGLGQVQSSAPTVWEASYWNNSSLSGQPFVQRQEATPNGDWGQGSPAPDINADNFSARWTTTVRLPTGRYRYFVTADDGARLWVDDRLVIDDWRIGAGQATAGEAYVGGDVRLRLEYFENTGLWLRLN